MLEAFYLLSKDDKDFVLSHTFHEEVDGDGEPFWWREVAGGGEGYIVVWCNGGSLHTYHHPADTWS